MSFSENLKKFRTQKGLSQQKLAELVGVSQTAIYNWEKGERTPKMDAITKIADVLGVKLNDLIPTDQAIDWFFEKVEENRITREYNALDNAIKDNLDKMNDSAKKKVYDYTEDLIQNPKNWKEKQ